MVSPAYLRSHVKAVCTESCTSSSLTELILQCGRYMLLYENMAVLRPPSKSPKMLQGVFAM